MLLMTSTHPQRKRQSRARVLGAFIEAQRRPLTGAGAEGTPTTDARPCVFSTFTRSNRRVTWNTFSTPVFPLSR